ncbi:biopolymer transporter ExbD [Luteolibacter ambystomatis]|uniref:Biopolymer transporter ExbD n=2 Tax=Luteolibacter ambystomatis TaxID=2824561 RepID=A0A975PFF0_9BACT|nr:biopolymer transporter ExbD [Luteolibacter ambystomatis]QUE51567.1 biopolymer transporter ExbD [Luteolibacter ambystomatis]
MQADDGKSYDDINVTPMVDLYLVLLLIFIIMTTAGVKGTKIDLPRGSKSQPKLGGPKTQAITVTPDGKILLNTTPVTLADLESRLGTLKASTPEFPVVVRGDRAVQYQGVMDVLDVLGRLGITQIGLATQAK